MTPPLTVLIAARDVLPALTERAEGSGAEVCAFADAEALKALEVITKRRPSVVALERLFAATARGAALINRIKTDPLLSASEIHIVSPDGDPVRVSPRTESDPVTGGRGTAASAARPAPLLDNIGTRRAVRHRTAASADVMVDGNQATLVDLSTNGAQVISGTVLKPNQRVRMALTDGQGLVRVNGAVAWASFEILPSQGPRYRAGIAFLDPDGPAVEAYCLRHRAS